MRRMLLSIVVAMLALVPAVRGQDAKPIKCLLLTGGCCHDYEGQKKLLQEELAKRMNIEFTVVHEGEGKNKGGTKHVFSVYSNPDWAKGYDVVIHNECFAAVSDEKVINAVAKAHADGVPAIFIHCALHTFRDAKTTDEWRKAIGVTSKSHEKSRQLTIKTVKADHPIMKGFPATWTTPDKDEMYVVLQQWETCVPLATAYGEDTKKDHPIIWINNYGKAKVFGTSAGHANKNLTAPEMMDCIARGLLWTTGHLQEDGKPAKGYEAPKK